GRRVPAPAVRTARGRGSRPDRCARTPAPPPRARPATAGRSPARRPGATRGRPGRRSAGPGSAPHAPARTRATPRRRRRFPAPQPVSVSVAGSSSVPAVRVPGDGPLLRALQPAALLAQATEPVLEVVPGLLRGAAGEQPGDPHLLVHHVGQDIAPGPAGARCG